MPFLFLSESSFPVEPGQLGIWILTAYGVMKIIEAGLKLADRFKKKEPLIPSPVLVQNVPKLVTQEEFLAFKAEMEKDLTAQEGKLDSLRGLMHNHHNETVKLVHEKHEEVLRNGEARAVKIHERINDLVDALNGRK